MTGSEKFFIATSALTLGAVGVLTVIVLRMRKQRDEAVAAAAKLTENYMALAKTDAAGITGEETKPA